MATTASGTPTAADFLRRSRATVDAELLAASLAQIISYGPSKTARVPLTAGLTNAGKSMLPDPVINVFGSQFQAMDCCPTQAQPWPEFSGHKLTFSAHLLGRAIPRGVSIPPAAGTHRAVCDLQEIACWTVLPRPGVAIPPRWQPRLSLGARSCHHCASAKTLAGG